MEESYKKKSYKIPSGDREVFVDPPLRSVTELINTNRERNARYGFSLCGMDYATLRSTVRRDIIGLAIKYTADLLSHWNIPFRDARIDGDDFNTNNAVIFQSGHAPSFYSPGVWIKSHLINKLAKSCSGVGVNVVMDNDIPEEYLVSVPDLSRRPPSIAYIGKINGNRRGMAYEELDGDSCSGPDGQTIGITRSIQVKCAALPNDIAQGKTASRPVNRFTEFLSQSAVCTSNIGEQITFARRRFEEGFGIDNLEIPISRICETGGFQLFFLAIAAESERFADTHNSCLNHYRKENGIRSSANPLPDLKAEVTGGAGIVELPFWTWLPGKRRSRLYTRTNREKDYLELLADDDNGGCSTPHGGTLDDKGLTSLGRLDIGGSPGNLASLRQIVACGRKIRPKALTNTLFCRLFFADVFIHGVGGAKYDIITDRIMADFFGLRAPEYITISATLFPPLPRFNIDDKRAPLLEEELKGMRHNPDKFIPKRLFNDRLDVQELVREKKKLIDESRNGGGNGARERFLRMKEVNRLLGGKIAPIIKEKELELDVIKEKLGHNAIVMNRNYPFFIYPEELLSEFYGCVLDGLD